jgi:hypothetical protein
VIIRINGTRTNISIFQFISPECVFVSASLQQ